MRVIWISVCKAFDIGTLGGPITITFIWTLPQRALQNPEPFHRFPLKRLWWSSSDRSECDVFILQPQITQLPHSQTQCRKIKPTVKFSESLRMCCGKEASP